jgi:hypothetical protein
MTEHQPNPHRWSTVLLCIGVGTTFLGAFAIMIIAPAVSGRTTDPFWTNVGVKMSELAGAIVILTLIVAFCEDLLHQRRSRRWRAGEKS